MSVDSDLCHVESENVTGADVVHVSKYTSIFLFHKTLSGIISTPPSGGSCFSFVYKKQHRNTTVRGAFSLFFFWQQLLCFLVFPPVDKEKIHVLFQYSQRLQSIPVSMNTSLTSTN